MAESKTQNDTPDTQAQLDELRALVATLQEQLTAKPDTNAQQQPFGSITMPDVHFDKGPDDEPKVIMTLGDDNLVVRERHAHILESLGWTVSGKAK